MTLLIGQASQCLKCLEEWNDPLISEVIGIADEDAAFPELAVHLSAKQSTAIGASNFAVEIGSSANHDDGTT